MKLTIKQIKQLIIEELDDLIGQPIYSAGGPYSAPMASMASDIISASFGGYSKIMKTFRKHARALHDERMELSDQRYDGSNRKKMVEALVGAMYAYQESPAKNLEALINIAEDIKDEYQTHDEREYGDDFDMDF